MKFTVIHVKVASFKNSVGETVSYNVAYVADADGNLAPINTTKSVKSGDVIDVRFVYDEYHKKWTCKY